jgi:hypothetical protein
MIRTDPYRLLQYNPATKAIARSLKKKRCWKEKHSSLGKAEAHKRHLIQRDLQGEGILDTYWCSGCRAWHVGHTKVYNHDEAI